MRKFIFYVFMHCITGFAAQEWQWARHSGRPGLVTSHGSSIGGVDGEGNTYLVSTISNDDKADPWNGYLLIKIDKYGNEVWSKNINQYFQGRITTDANGNSYVTFYNKVILFDKDGNETLLISGSGQTFGHSTLRQEYIIVTGHEAFGDSTKMFFSKYDFNGILLSTRYFRASKFVKGLIDVNENVITIDGLDPYPHAKNKTVLRKFDGDNNLIYIKDIPPSCRLFDDPYANTFLLGYNENPSFSSAEEFKQKGYFIIKYDSLGKLLWYKLIDSNLGASRVETDQHGNLYYVVDFSAHIKIDDFEITHPTGGLLVIKFDKDGNKIWHQFTPSYNTGPFGYLQPESIFVDQNNDIYLSGRISGTLQFGNSLLKTKSEMYTELFVGKLSQKNLVGFSEAEAPEYQWTIFPNPSGDFFSVRGYTDQSLIISVTDARGQLIRSDILQGQNKQVDLSAFAPGVYFLQIKSGERVETRKIVKN